MATYKEAIHTDEVPLRDKAPWLILIVVFLVSICALALSVGALVLAKPGNEPEEASIQSLVQELNKSVSELKAAFKLGPATHERHYQQLNNTIFTAVESVKTVSAAKELDLMSGCLLPITSTCLINYNDIGTPPASAT